jgi:indole-3-glycerol phosphate synthase
VPPDTYLTEILAAHRARAAGDERSLDGLVAEALSTPQPRAFGRRLSVPTGGELAVIAEVKRRSPSKGVLDAALDPAAVARTYEDGGAACVSVLTDVQFFEGSRADLEAVRGACGLPILRKDFTVGAADVCDARIMGADAVLLIVAALSDDELLSLRSLAQELSLDVLVEVHDEADLERALDTGAELVGVNQRDLTTFSVEPDRAVRLAPLIPAEVVAVAESGIRDADDVRRLADVGYQAVLVGEALVRAADRRAALRTLGGHPVGARAAVPDAGARRG